MRPHIQGRGEGEHVVLVRAVHERAQPLLLPDQLRQRRRLHALVSLVGIGVF